ncbi:MAG: hypothetical protein HQ596_02615 [Candidatus Saganbacteria bacterium]|nr:hypothetical protein [Candidatus Saganbacteria bacterium]
MANANGVNNNQNSHPKAVEHATRDIAKKYVQNYGLDKIREKLSEATKARRDGKS